MGPWGKLVPVWFTPLIFVHLLLEILIHNQGSYFRDDNSCVRGLQ